MKTKRIIPDNGMDRSDVIRYGDQCYEAGYYSCLEYKSSSENKKIKNIIGWTAAILLLVAYFLLSFNFLKSSDVTYNTLNLFGGIGLAWRVYQDRNYSNFVLEIIFILIALKAIFF